MAVMETGLGVAFIDVDAVAIVIDEESFGTKGAHHCAVFVGAHLIIFTVAIIVIARVWDAIVVGV